MWKKDQNRDWLPVLRKTPVEFDTGRVPVPVLLVPLNSLAIHHAIHFGVMHVT